MLGLVLMAIILMFGQIFILIDSFKKRKLFEKLVYEAPSNDPDLFKEVKDEMFRSAAVIGIQGGMLIIGITFLVYFMFLFF